MRKRNSSRDIFSSSKLAFILIADLFTPLLDAAALM
jgi:hypothetical protein